MNGVITAKGRNFDVKNWGRGYMRGIERNVELVHQGIK
jgi:hypothetical protein